MSTFILQYSPFSTDLSDSKAGLSLFRRVQLGREAKAKAYVRSYLARQSTQRLADLGFDADDIAAVRRGEFQLPHAPRSTSA